MITKIIVLAILGITLFFAVVMIIATIEVCEEMKEAKKKCNCPYKNEIFEKTE